MEKSPKFRPENLCFPTFNTYPCKPILKHDDLNHVLQMEKQKPLNELYGTDWKNSGPVVCANLCQTKTPTGGGKVSVKLSSPESGSYNTPLRHGRLVWNIPQSSQPPSQLIWMSALTLEVGHTNSHLCQATTLPYPSTHILTQILNTCCLLAEGALCVTKKT